MSPDAIQHPLTTIKGFINELERLDGDLSADEDADRTALLAHMKDAVLDWEVAAGGQKGVGKVFLRRRQGRQVKGDEAGWVDIDGVTDGHQHLGDLSGIVVSRLFEGSDSHGHNGLCRPVTAERAGSKDLCPRPCR